MVKIPLVYFACLLFLVRFDTSTAQADEDTTLRLELASVVFRHGDRSPIRTFPTDSYTESDWPQGYGQLSITGMQQHYHLGQLLKARYVENSTHGFICANYSRVQVRIESTDVDRTLMSAESQLSALFPPDDSQKFEDSLPWQPIPIHTVHTMNDTILRATDNCPAYGELREQDKESAAYKQMEEDHKEFFANMSKYIGLPVNLSNAWGIEDTIKIEYLSPGYDEPSWATEEVREKFQYLADYSLTLMFNSTQKRRLSAGNWMNKVLGDMKNKVNPNGNKTYEDMKLFLYSAHDTTVAAMSSGLGVFNDHQPGYASALAVELYSDSKRNYYVKMFRRNGPDCDDFEPLNATYCKKPTLCTLQEFEKYVTPLVPTDFASECSSTHNNTTPSPTSSPTPSTSQLEKENQTLRVAVITLGSVLCLVLLVTIVLAVILLTVCRKKSANAQRLYRALHTDS